MHAAIGEIYELRSFPPMRPRYAKRQIGTRGQAKQLGEDMKLPFAKWEFFVECPAPHQRGYWIDRVPGEWVRVGLGVRLLTLAHLPRKHND